MDFERAEYGGPSSQPSHVQPCAVCTRPLERQYWSVGAAMVCGPCAEVMSRKPGAEGGFWRFLKALMLGNGAGLLGAIGYGAIISLAHLEIALVTIFIGWFVGRAVLKGSEERGGRGYQVLSAALTYGWCMMAYVPSLIEGASQAKDAPPVIVTAIVAPFIALILPFSGEMGLLSVLILSFGVWQGWKEPRARVVTVTGPFDLGAVPASEPAAAPAQAEAAPALASTEAPGVDAG